MTSSKKFGKVAVIYGGTSAEREVSLKSGKAVLDGLLQQNINAVGIDAQTDLINQLENGNFDRAFIVLHGRGGEDGTLQGTLEALELPYTGSSVLGSALAMDKYRSKLIWLGLGLPTAKFLVLDNNVNLEDAEILGYPLIVKPAREGSSLGIKKVDNQQQLIQAWDEAKQFDDLIIAEKWITGKEFTVAILQNRAFPTIRLETQNQFYDYEAKYESDETLYHCPCGLDSAQEQEIQALALQAFEALGIEGWGRIDFMQDKEGHFYLLEANTVPGMTSHSLVPMAVKAAGIAFNELLLLILETSTK